MNFPNNKKAYSKIITKSNLGMSLENMINASNEFYLANNKAVIYKKPTPVQIVHVDYPARNKAVITEAYYKTPSTTDYNGIYKGRYIDFEAKETKSLTSFPLSNIHPHQVLHLKRITLHGGIGFFIVCFTRLNEVYILPYELYDKYRVNNSAKKSIPYSFFKERCYLVVQSFNPELKYLDVVDKLMAK